MITGVGLVAAMCVALVAGCAPSATSTGSASSTPQAALAPAASPTSTTIAPEEPCLISYPSRFENDSSPPAVIEWEGATPAECQAFVERDIREDPFSRSHPPTLVDARPIERPRCTGPFGDHRVKVWGGRYADLLCITVNYDASQAP